MSPEMLPSPTASDCRKLILALYSSERGARKAVTHTHSHDSWFSMPRVASLPDCKDAEQLTSQGRIQAGRKRGERLSSQTLLLRRKERKEVMSFRLGSFTFYRGDLLGEASEDKPFVSLSHRRSRIWGRPYTSLWL